jgi:AbrB family looped-hinge helix DNA binding protein
MTKFSATMTQQGKVTIPASIRRKLGLRPGDKVVFTINEDEVTLTLGAPSLEEIFGSVKPINRPEDFAQLIQKAKAERAAKYFQEDAGG